MRTWLWGAVAAAVAALAATGMWAAVAMPDPGFGLPVAWLAALPLAASLLVDRCRTAVVAAGALVLAIVLGAATGSLASQRTWFGLLTVVLLSAIAVANAVLRGRTDEELERAVVVAQTVQDAIRGAVPADAAGVRLAARSVSADDDIAVGGDVVEVVQTPNSSRILIADVSGHGLAAVRVAAGVAAAFRESARREGDGLAEAAGAVNNYVTSCGRDEGFVTAVFLEFEPAGWLQVINCGHPPPFRLRARSAEAKMLAPAAASPPLGLDPRLRSDSFQTADGDRIVVCTDGGLEARSPNGEVFRFEEHLDLLRDQDAQRGVDRLVQAVLDHAGRREHDDVTVLVAEVVTERQSQQARVERVQIG
jgi:hypothetical protein